VVISVLPDGEYGTASAAAVATSMLRTFSNIRICLMVGIGGGVPSKKHDIRLGDVVVSAAQNGESGVFQYDFGKTVQGQSAQYTMSLNMPPTILRTAVSEIRAKYERFGHQIADTIGRILSKPENGRLRKKYGQPALNSDRLYRASFAHTPDEGMTCNDACGDDPSNLVPRPQRDEDDDYPVIHYGLIASGNQVMKDASIRDKLAKEKDILCFEMEAAGLMNRFPCLVIRGICDYSDSHKHKEWQGFAAMAAAAYAKDLLSFINPNKVEETEKLKVALSSSKSVRSWQEHRIVY
jgi:nucleoside phosphorylase